MANNHPNVGNGLMLYDQDASGNVTTLEEVYPVVNGGTGSYETNHTIVELRRATDHSVLCSFNHTQYDAYGRRSLGAVSAVGIAGQGYVAACGWNCDDFYIYRLDDPKPGSCGATLVSRLRARGAGANTSRVLDGGAGDRNWGLYNGVSMIVNEQNQVFMVGTHQSFMDTWEITGMGTAAPSFHKLAKFRWEGKWPTDGKYYFQQGVSIELVSDRRIAIWLSPHDYRSSGAQRYVRLYRCERQL